MIKSCQNVIITKSQRFESYFSKANVRSPILAKAHVWESYFSNFLSAMAQSASASTNTAPSPVQSTTSFPSPDRDRQPPSERVVVDEHLRQQLPQHVAGADSVAGAVCRPEAVHGLHDDGDVLV